MTWTPVFQFGSVAPVSAVGGAPGRPGADANQWLAGKGSPAQSQGRERDFYLDRVSGDVYQKTSPFWGVPPAWLKIGNLQLGIAGPPGKDGQRGPAGFPGPAGAAGAAGAAGVPGTPATIPTTGWSAVNGILWNDYNVPYFLGAQVVDVSPVQWRLLTQSLSGHTKFTLIATVRGFFTGTVQTQVFGVYVTDGTKLEAMEVMQGGGSTATNRLRVERMTSVTADSATMAGPTSNLCPQMLTVKVVEDGTHLTWSYWEAGAFVQFYQENTAAFLTATSVGIGGASVGGSAIDALYLDLLQWSLTLQ